MEILAIGWTYQTNALVGFHAVYVLDRYMETSKRKLQISLVVSIWAV